ncbi:hypothetical protein DK389_26950 [Methylobacterium durans]|uniref:Uncharacterized protein n=1 Tax=Methylobacterium durans TaxID=2202825 RepID=A0A2U8WBP6_9HYPH|nr:hypothetical protein DK389_26950 [Methylobacterium durans]
MPVAVLRDLIVRNIWQKPLSRLPDLFEGGELCAGIVPGHFAVDVDVEEVARHRTNLHRE